MRYVTLIGVVAALATGCVTTEPLLHTIPPPSQTEPLVSLKPSTPEELAQGLVQSYAQSDLGRAVGYYLSDEEFTALFTWEESSDPRSALARELAAGAERLAVALKEARFVNVTELRPETARVLKQGQTIAGLTFRRDTPAYDYMDIMVEVGGVQKLLHVEGLVQVNGYWRLFSPNYRLR